MKLSRLELLELRTEDGRRLGRVFGLRMHRSPAPDLWPDEVESLVYGTLGLLERLGLRAARTRTMPWREVVGVRDGALIVRPAPGAAPARAGRHPREASRPEGARARERRSGGDTLPQRR
jgi:hypothetical protein